MIIGLTGGIGSGKTTVSDMFKAHGIDIIDADIVARRVVEPGTKALEQIAVQFGKAILLANGELNRAQLRTIIFNSSSDKEWLNQLLHPLIRQEMLSQLKAAKSSYCILVAPLLIENKLEQFVNRVLVIDINEAQQIERTAKRDHSDEGEVKKIIASQISRSERLAAADDVIDNSSNSADNISIQVGKLHEKYLELAKKSDQK
ncbi:dephospho-CoA kinase [Thalassotalea atypica]|uniref:dephospho-CoA kinase n=1 Tax=Thalassotalea atypica TaxID=2054316 RepID=UPI0025729DDF|nr:dephospho-CoA kinase [Thalassotalea atypica]